MVNIQNEFNNRFSETEKEIEFEYKNFQGQQLVIEDYSELESLYLLNNKNVDRVILRNLEQLEECEIFNCGMKNLIIENCPQIKKIDIRNNSLTSLDFLASLENLEELEIDDNTEVNSGLKYLPRSLKKFSYKNTDLTEFLKSN